MKIRWNSKELRYRITPGELERLRNGESITEAFAFAEGWQAVLSPAEESSLRFSAAGGVTISLSEADRVALAQEENEGVYLQADSGTGPVRYFVEKDFPCLHPRPSEVLPGEGETFAPTASFLARAEQ